MLTLTRTVAAVAVRVVVALGLILKHAQADEISAAAYCTNAAGTARLPSIGSSLFLRGGLGAAVGVHIAFEKVDVD
jgi:hypothetical protein